MACACASAEPPSWPDLADRWRVAFHGLDRIDVDTERFVLDVDQRSRFHGGFFGVREHDRDRLTIIDDLVAREHGASALRGLRAARQQILAGEHVDDAGHSLGRADVDALDAGVGLIGRGQPCMQHARQVEISRIQSLPADFLW